MGVAGAAVGTVLARAIGAGLYLVLLVRGTRHGRVRFPAAAGAGLAADSTHAENRDAPGPRRRRPQRGPGGLSGAAGGGGAGGGHCTRRRGSGCRCGWSACCRPWRSRSRPPPSWVRPSAPAGSTGPKPWGAEACKLLSVIMAGVVALTFAFARPLAALFIADAEVVPLAATVLRWFAVAQFFSSVSICVQGRADRRGGHEAHPDPTPSPPQWGLLLSLTVIALIGFGWEPKDRCWRGSRRPWRNSC